MNKTPQEIATWLIPHITKHAQLSQMSLKGAAEMLRAESALKHTQSLEIVARAAGFRSWNVAKAMLPTGAYAGVGFSFTQFTYDCARVIHSDDAHTAIEVLKREIFDGTASIETRRRSGPRVICIDDEPNIFTRETRESLDGGEYGFWSFCLPHNGPKERLLRQSFQRNPDLIVYVGHPTPQEASHLNHAVLTGHYVLIFADPKFKMWPLCRVGEDAGGSLFAPT